jgi:hypothetical protein
MSVAGARAGSATGIGTAGIGATGIGTAETAMEIEAGTGIEGIVDRTTLSSMS